jgi:hypothetical protein
MVMMTCMPGPRVVPLVEALVFQRNACADLGSALYAEVLDAVIADVGADGPCAAILRPHEREPFGSALPLRFLGSIHRLVLEGRAPRLATHYPSVGGSPGPSLADDFVATVAELRPAIEARVDDGVQTNEVGRSAALVGGFVEVARRGGLPLRLLELGASAGLNLRWDRYWYDTGASTFGDPASAVRFVGVWDGRRPVLDDVVVRITAREGCDRSPIDPTDGDGRLTLRAYLWPDMIERRARLDAALAIAAGAPASVHAADLGEWLETRLAVSAPGRVTVVYHSIVWQYVDGASRARMRAALRKAGEAAGDDAPLGWLRLEPAGRVADLRLTWWPGGTEEVLATSGYHGTPVHWGRHSEPDAPQSIRV